MLTENFKLKQLRNSFIKQNMLMLNTHNLYRWKKKWHNINVKEDKTKATVLKFENDHSLKKNIYV